MKKTLILVTAIIHGVMTFGQLDPVKINSQGVKENRVAISELNDKVNSNQIKILGEVTEALSHSQATARLLFETGSVVRKNKENIGDLDNRVTEIDGKLYEAGITRKPVLKSDKNREMINGNSDKINEIDSMLYEETTIYNTGGKILKADKNREMITQANDRLATQGEAVDKNTKANEENKKEIKKNTEKIERNTSKIDQNTNNIQRNSDRIDRIDTRIKSLESEMNRGFAMSAATSSIVYPELGEGDLGVGAGVGGYGNAQAVAIGLAMQPSESVRVNANVSTSDGQDVMYGAGMGYKFNLFN